MSFCFSESKGQIDSVFSRLNFEMDFRFRAEQDWDSRKSDGSYREDRSRLRYRFRTGVTYAQNWYSVGFRIRTGDQRKQQDPQLTLGKGLKEFGTLPLGFEKIYFQAYVSNFKLWLGKHTFPFEKSNELFWSNNVFPEGIALSHQFNFDNKLIDKIQIKGGHFILSSNDANFSNDAYMQGFQSVVHLANNLITLFPSLYLFRNIADIPDGGHTFLLDYTIAHFGSRVYLLENRALKFEFDFYYNLENYDSNQGISNSLKKEKSGYVVGIKYGNLKKEKAWLLKLTYAYLQRFSVLDYMAQNDWARWDYSSNNSPDGRLSNLQGVEWVVGYAISPKVNLITKYYTVRQLVPYGTETETGQRVRFDINIKL